MELERYLPLGSVIRLKKGTKRIMVYGRRQVQPEKDIQWDYAGCPFPEGNLSKDYTLLFNHEDVEQVYFLGLQDEEEFAFQKVLKEG